MPTSRPEYDQLQRASIRRGLLAYKRAHNIGAPILRKRIAEANNRPIELVNIKTLYRFLAGDNPESAKEPDNKERQDKKTVVKRTNDAFVHMCAQLHAPDPLPAMVKALADFYGMHDELPQGACIISTMDGSFLQPFASLEVSRHEVYGVSTEPGNESVRYDGVAIGDASTALLFLKDCDLLDPLTIRTGNKGATLFMTNEITGICRIKSASHSSDDETMSDSFSWEQFMTPKPPEPNSFQITHGRAGIDKFKERVNRLKQSGLTDLHLAILFKRLDSAKLLIKQGVAFVPDNLGRYPSTLAAECRLVDWDFIAEAEAEYLDKNPPPDV